MYVSADNVRCLFFQGAAGEWRVARVVTALSSSLLSRLVTSTYARSGFSSLQAVLWLCPPLKISGVWGAAQRSSGAMKLMNA